MQNGSTVTESRPSGASQGPATCSHHSSCCRWPLGWLWKSRTHARTPGGSLKPALLCAGAATQLKPSWSETFSLEHGPDRGDKGSKPAELIYLSSSLEVQPTRAWLHRFLRLPWFSSFPVQFFSFPLNLVSNTVLL